MTYDNNTTSDNHNNYIIRSKSSSNNIILKNTKNSNNTNNTDDILQKYINNNINTPESQLKYLIKENKDLQNELKKEKSQRKQDKKNMDILKRTINNLISQNKKDVINTSSPNKTYADLLLSLGTLSNENNNLNKKINDLISDKKVEKNEFEQTKYKLINKEQEINDYMAKNEELNNKCQILESQAIRLTDNLRDFKQFEKIRALNESLEKELKIKNDENESSEDEDDENDFDIYQMIRSKSCNKRNLNKNSDSDDSEESEEKVSEENDDIESILYGKEQRQIFKNIGEDNFEDTDSVVKYIDFDEVFLTSHNIFSENIEKNNLYSKYIQKFDEIFDKVILKIKEKKSLIIKKSKLDNKEEKETQILNQSEATKDDDSSNKNFN
jgi:hypothetical protein